MVEKKTTFYWAKYRVCMGHGLGSYKLRRLSPTTLKGT